MCSSLAPAASSKSLVSFEVALTREDEAFFGSNQGEPWREHGGCDLSQHGAEGQGAGGPDLLGAFLGEPVDLEPDSAGDDRALEEAHRREGQRERRGAEPRSRRQQAEEDGVGADVEGCQGFLADGARDEARWDLGDDIAGEEARQQQRRLGLAEPLRLRPPPAAPSAAGGDGVGWRGRSLTSTTCDD